MKKWYLSKTILFNLLTGLVAVAGAFGFASFQPDPQTSEIIGAFATIFVVGINIILRFLTKEPVG